MSTARSAGLAARALRFLRSPRLAVGLLVYLAALSVVTTFVPQGAPQAPKVAGWIAAQPVWSALAISLGMNHAYTSWPFLVGVGLLAVSTALCAWQRTEVSWRRLRTARDATPAGLARMAGSASTVELAPGEAPGALEHAEGALRGLGLKTARSEDAVSGSARWIGLVGSPIFHWALVAMILLVVAGQLTRADGLMGVPLGQRVPNSAASYGALSAGPLYSFGGQVGSVGVKTIESPYVVGGIDMGPTPLVTLYAPSAAPIAEDRVYPNHPLHYGATTVHASDYGLAASFELLNASGSVVATTSGLIDFNDAAANGTTPASFTLSDGQGRPAFDVSVSVPADRLRGSIVRARPASPTADLIVSTSRGAAPTAASTKASTRATLKLGEAATLPDGARLRFAGLGYYARLSVVDDWTVPWLYGLFGVALIGITLSTLVGPRLALVRLLTDGEGTPAVSVWVGRWRGSSSFHDRAERAVLEAVTGTTDRTEGGR